MTPTPELLGALAYIYNAREMQVFRRWLGAAAWEEAVRAVKATENADVMRGRAQALLSLHQMIEDAPQALERLEKRNGPAKPDEAWNPQRGH